MNKKKKRKQTKNNHYKKKDEGVKGEGAYKTGRGLDTDI